MTELAPKHNLFDKSFETEDLYMAQLKSGLKVCFTKRAEIWKDKTACYWVTLYLLCLEDVVDKERDFLDDNGIVYAIRKDKVQFDVRYNEIGAIWEI